MKDRRTYKVLNHLTTYVAIILNTKGYPLKEGEAYLTILTTLK